jgi:hypothetical protein
MFLAYKAYDYSISALKPKRELFIVYMIIERMFMSKSVDMNML